MIEYWGIHYFSDSFGKGPIKITVSTFQIPKIRLHIFWKLLNFYTFFSTSFLSSFVDFPLKGSELTNVTIKHIAFQLTKFYFMKVIWMKFSISIVTIAIFIIFVNADSVYFWIVAYSLYVRYFVMLFLIISKVDYFYLFFFI